MPARAAHTNKNSHKLGDYVPKGTVSLKAIPTHEKICCARLFVGRLSQRLGDDVQVLADVDVADLAVVHGLELLLLHGFLKQLFRSRKKKRCRVVPHSPHKRVECCGNN